MILMTGFYSDSDPRRRGELLECVKRNVENDQIHEHRVFIEDDTPRETVPFEDFTGTGKLTVIPWGQRLTFRSLFDYANQNLENQVVIIANADIFFGESLARLQDYDLTGKLLCLSRWEVLSDGSVQFFEHPDSQDAWIFKTPLPQIECDFQLGVPACDNRLAWEAERAGLKVINPARTIRACHLHLSYVRRYSERQRLAGPVKCVPARALETRYPSARGPAPKAPAAAVAFSEAMGYAIKQLEIGTSSHTNEQRAFITIPEPLAGLSFTQVVAYVVAPVEIEFITSGKLYVLVGNDWDGYHSATAWLSQNGFKENLPLLATEADAGFEVWSIVAESGERYVLPTQVMLVAEYLVKRNSGAGDVILRPNTRKIQKESIFALTSLSPHADRELTTTCIQSWQRAGLEVRSFNHPTEISELSELFEVEFIAVENTSAHQFGAHFVPINAMLTWAALHDVPALIINSDIELQLDPWEMKRVRWLSESGLCYVVRYNHNGDRQSASREPHGIDAFLLHGRDADIFPQSFLSMGKPFWDYWLPHTFSSHGRQIYALEFPAAFHLTHPNRWSWSEWHQCALEFERATGGLDGPKSFEACHARAQLVRQTFDRDRVCLSPRPPGIREWVEEKFRYPGKKTFFELGAHRGADTAWMAEIPGVAIYALEPDPRNTQPARSNLILHHAAIADFDGRGLLTLSEAGWGREWTFSSSIKEPLNHLQRFPVTFGGTVEVEMTTLDSFSRNLGIGVVDFIFADIQGAEGEMIRGGRETLARTRYLFTEYSDDQLYEGQITLSEILGMLPDFRVVELWPDDVLLENTRFRE